MANWVTRKLPITSSRGTINSGVVYTFNGIQSTGGLQTLVASPDIKWESKAITNVGFDGSFLDGHLDVSAEYYNAKSTDILVGITIPASVGFENINPVVNAASLRNSGVEFSLGYHKTKGDFTFDVSANLSTVKNKVLALGGNNEPLIGVGAKTVVGREVGEHYGFVYEGIFQTRPRLPHMLHSLAPRLNRAMLNTRISAVPMASPMG